MAQHALLVRLWRRRAVAVFALPSCERRFGEGSRQPNLDVREVRFGENRTDLAEEFGLSAVQLLPLAVHSSKGSLPGPSVPRRAIRQREMLPLR